MAPAREPPRARWWHDGRALCRRFVTEDAPRYLRAWEHLLGASEGPYFFGTNVRGARLVRAALMLTVEGGGGRAADVRRYPRVRRD